MALDRNALETGLATVLRDNFATAEREAWSRDRAADELARAIADAVHAYVSAAEVSGVETVVRDPANVEIGSGRQTAPVNLA